MVCKVSDTSDDSAEKRDLVDAAAKIEAILDEIKKFFKPEEKRGAIVHLAERWDRIIKKIKHSIRVYSYIKLLYK